MKEEFNQMGKNQDSRDEENGISPIALQTKPSCYRLLAISSESPYNTERTSGFRFELIISLRKEEDEISNTHGLSMMYNGFQTFEFV